VLSRHGVPHLAAAIRLPGKVSEPGVARTGPPRQPTCAVAFGSLGRVEGVANSASISVFVSLLTAGSGIRVFHVSPYRVAIAYVSLVIVGPTT
jgi:hypothetical protein